MVVDINDIPDIRNCVYKITSPSGKVYIGSTRCLAKRLKEYICVQCVSQRKIYNSLKKYGSSNHIFEVVEKDIEFDKIFERELYWGILYDATGKNGLTCRLPSSGDKKCVLSEETLIRMSEAHKGRKVSKETREKLSKSLIGNTRTKGKKLTEETKRRISEGLRNMDANVKIQAIEKRRAYAIGRGHSSETRKKLSKSLKGKGLGLKLSDAHRKKISDSLKGNTRSLGFKHSEETKLKIKRAWASMSEERLLEIYNKMSESHKGKRHTEESRKKMSEWQIGRKMKPEWIDKRRVSMIGFKHSEESKKKISESLKGNKRSLGFKHSEKTKLSIGNSWNTYSEEKRMEISKKISIRGLGRKHTDESKRKMSIALKGKGLGRSPHPNQLESACKIVIDNHTGVFYSSSKELADLHGRPKTCILSRLNSLYKSPGRFSYA